MAQNVTIAGNQYPSVPAIQVPKTGGGGNATFTDTSPTTASASDVAQGKIFFDSTGTQQTGTASGGASNIVTGTFKGTTTGAAMDVTLNYSGSGYPIIFAIYPTGGPGNPNTNFINLIQRYACAYFVGVKSEMSSSPNYASGNNGNLLRNAYSVYQRFKNSTTIATTYGGTAVDNAYIAKNDDAASAQNSQTNVIARFRSKTSMSVFIASTSYGFVANIEYTYYIIYSS